MPINPNFPRTLWGAGRDGKRESEFPNAAPFSLEQWPPCIRESKESAALRKVRRDLEGRT
jgi:hypothetical protein